MYMCTVPYGMAYVHVRVDIAWQVGYDIGMTTQEYEETRSKCIKTFGKLYKDAVVFDMCKVDKQTRLRLQQDPVYITETKALKARLFLDQLDVLENVLSGSYAGEKPTDQSGNILKALEMKNKLLLEDLSVNKDESNALNVTFTALSAEDFEALDTVEVSRGSNHAELGADFGASEDNDSFEARMKADINDRMKSLEGGK